MGGVVIKSGEWGGQGFVCGNRLVRYACSGNGYEFREKLGVLKLQWFKSFGIPKMMGY